MAKEGVQSRKFVFNRSIEEYGLPRRTSLMLRCLDTVDYSTNDLGLFK